MSVLGQPDPGSIPVQDTITQGRADVLGVVWTGRTAILSDPWGREQACAGPDGNSEASRRGQ